jgi:hypothetical protein
MNDPKWAQCFYPVFPLEGGSIPITAPLIRSVRTCCAQESLVTDNATQSAQSAAKPSSRSTQLAKNYSASERDSLAYQVVITTRPFGSSGRRSKSN